MLPPLLELLVLELPELELLVLELPELELLLVELLLELSSSRVPSTIATTAPAIIASPNRTLAVRPGTLAQE